MPIGCLDPSKPLISQGHFSQLDGVVLKPGLDSRIPLLQLPPEIIVMILGYLSPSDVIQFFCVGERALLYADEFCRRNPYHFYRCSDADGYIVDKRKLVISLAIEFSNSNYRQLDMRWEIVSKVANRAGLLLLVDKDCTAEKTLDPKAPLNFLSHRFGFHEVILQIPDDVETVEIFSVQLDSGNYVCGIGFQSKKTYSFCGKKTQLLRRVGFPVAAIDTIRFAVDELGIRSLTWGSSQGLLEDPGCWEGFSLKQSRREIRIVHDVRGIQCSLKYMATHVDHRRLSFAMSTGVSTFLLHFQKLS